MSSNRSITADLKDEQVSVNSESVLDTRLSMNTCEVFCSNISMPQPISTTTTLERDKPNHQSTGEIFTRLLRFASESDRPLFCERLQTIWQEQGIFCQAYPTITNQILDLYKLHQLVQEKQGYLEITTNRGWKEISNVLGFGDSGSAAYSVKRNYVRLGLLAYECRFDRAGIDPRSVIELSEMPHTVKKKKRATNTSTSTTRAIIKANKQQLQDLSIQHDIKKSLTPLPVDIQHLTKYSSFRRSPQQIPIPDFQSMAYMLRAGHVADSNKCLDTLLVWLSDPRTASCCNLRQCPGLFNALMEQYTACLYELFGQSFCQSEPTNDCYMDYFLQLKLRVNDTVLGPKSDQHRLETFFYGTRRYVLKRLMRKRVKSQLNHNPLRNSSSSFIDTFDSVDQSQTFVTDAEADAPDTDRFHSITIRCSCLSTIIRNLSFIEENEYLANDRRLLDVLERILSCQHQELHQILDYTSCLYPEDLYTCSNCSDKINMEDSEVESGVDSTIQDDTGHDEITPSNDFLRLFTKSSTDIPIDDPLCCFNDCQHLHLMYLLDNTLITLSNLSTSIDLRRCHPSTRSRLINTILHWIVCSLSLANEPFISMSSEDKLPDPRKEQISISPRQISLQILAKLCISESNVDLILLDSDFQQLKSLGHTLLSLMNTTHPEDVNREYSLMIISCLCKRNRTLVEFFCSHLVCLELIFNYLESYEYHQQEYLIATLTSCCTASATVPISIPINHSADMMIDSCVQLLVLFASVKEKNYLKLFEYKLVDMLSSIYFEQRILTAFADILFIMKA